MLILCLPLILFGCTQALMQAPNTESGIPVRFIYTDGQAREVCVAGSFNQWSPKTYCMRKEGDTWAFDVFLPPGRYQYVFIIDGTTSIPDPGAFMTEDTGFGAKNSVLVVE